MNVDQLVQMIPEGRVVHWRSNNVSYLHDLMTGRTFLQRSNDYTSPDLSIPVTTNGRDPFPDVARWRSSIASDTPIYAYRGHLVVGPRIGLSANCPTCVIIRLLAADPARRAMGIVWSSRQRHYSEWFGRAVSQLGALTKASELKMDDDGFTAFVRPFSKDSAWSMIEFKRLPGCPEHHINNYSISLGLG